MLGVSENSTRYLASNAAAFAEIVLDTTGMDPDAIYSDENLIRVRTRTDYGLRTTDICRLVKGEMHILLVVRRKYIFKIQTVEQNILHDSPLEEPKRHS